MRTDEPYDVTWDGLHCSLTVRRPLDGVVVLVFRGTDVGEFGDRPFVAIERHLDDGLPIELWVDGRATLAASIDVSGDWARWFRARRLQLHRVNVLCGSDLLAVTVGFAARFGELRRVRIFRDADRFDRALASACDPGDR
jgi:hypothetical protein